MAATQQSQTINMANTLVAILQQLNSLQIQIGNVANQFTAVTAATVMNNLSTTSLNADGSLGTPDPKPVNSNPIDPRVYPGLSWAVSANDLASIVTLAQAVQSLLAGSVPQQQGEAPQLLSKYVGG